jgi:hypothetical protein
MLSWHGQVIYLSLLLLTSKYTNISQSTDKKHIMYTHTQKVQFTRKYVTILYFTVQNRSFCVSFDEAFSRSLSTTHRNVLFCNTRKQTLVYQLDLHFQRANPNTNKVQALSACVISVFQLCSCKISTQKQLLEHSPVPLTLENVLKVASTTTLPLCPGRRYQAIKLNSTFLAVNSQHTLPICMAA